MPRRRLPDAYETVALGLISPERAQLRRDELHGMALGEGALRTIRQAFADKGAVGALEEADSLFNDSALVLSAAERQRFLGRAHALVNDLHRRQGMTEAEQRDAEARLYADRLIGLDRELGAGRLDQLTVDDLFRDQKIGKEDRTRYTTALRRQQEETERVSSAFARVGLAPPTSRQRDPASLPSDLADRFIAAESGGNPNARNPNSSATGPGQFTDGTWKWLMSKAAPEVAAGKSDAELLALRTDSALSRRMVEAYADENRKALSAAGPRSAGHRGSRLPAGQQHRLRRRLRCGPARGRPGRARRLRSVRRAG
ncbi:hypothetical protein M2352_000338 [Azospirillum fermentarium]|uniref:hypothetical protein n=1 Tax=Azospirillum fermentarium TaxID=1233114 RepID=UPI002225E3C3|nr:hypothetical protein [Azospirillum fermentarium]MCW2244747.1 hypothetical protein [Azospirillum fermentarium]